MTGKKRFTYHFTYGAKQIRAIYINECLKLRLLPTVIAANYPIANKHAAALLNIS